MTSGQWPVNQCYCLTNLYKPLLLHISFSTRGWQWRCLIRGSRLTWPRRQSTSREWRGECPVFRNGWLLWMRQVNVETLEFGFQAAMNKYKRLSYWKFVMKVLNCVLVNIDSVLIKWLFDEVWSQVVILLGIWGMKPCRHSHSQFSCHLPGRFGNVLPASMWIKGLIISKSDSWLDCAAPHGIWFDMITEFQIIIEAIIWSLFCTCYETSGPDFDSILT